ncbi:MAG TPA: CoA pyrophosphatase [Flavobacterium sp.]
MDFDQFLKLIPKIAKELLPGEEAHQKMAPPERMDVMKKLDIEKMNVRRAAVLMLVYPNASRAHLALILRNSYNGVHSSQIAFPGGKVETFDESYRHTALRETHEEIGIPPEQVNVVRDFSPIYIPPSNFKVYPFLAYSTGELAFVPDPAEVAGMVALPLAQFLDESTVVDRVMATSYSESIIVPTFKIGEHYIWGATAMMLNELKEVLKRVL